MLSCRFPDRSPTWPRRTCLVTVGELGPVGAAAHVHGVGQPAASMRLRSLNEYSGPAAAATKEVAYC